MKKKTLLLCLMLMAAVSISMATAACDDKDDPQQEEQPVDNNDKDNKDGDDNDNKGGDDNDNKGGDDQPTPPAAGARLVGGDISLLPSYIRNQAKYLDSEGKAIDNPLTFFCNTLGWNATRVRLFVDPSNATEEEKGQGVVQSLDYVKALAADIAKQGMTFMLDLHYSDTWADPANQWTPKDWLTAKTDEELCQRLEAYTADVLKQIAAVKKPEYVQIGNEISYGMLWGERGSKANRCYAGSNDNWQRFTTLLKAAIKVCRETLPDTKIVIHTERAAQTNVLTNFYNKMKEAEVDYDVIGLSYYPYYHGNINTLDKAITTLEQNFPDKTIQIVETGCSYHYKMGDQDTGYPLTEQGQKQFTTDLIACLSKHSKVTGLYWWFPEANEYGLDWQTKRVTDQWYNASLFDNETGKAQQAAYVLRDFLN